MNITLYVAIGLVGLATLLYIIGTAIPYWLCIRIDGHHYEGLFRGCAETNGERKCQSSEEIPNWLKATQAMMLLSILAMSGGIFLSLLFGFIMKDKLSLSLAAACITFTGAVLACIGVIIYGAKITELGKQKYLHAGFGLAIVAAILAVPGSVLMVFSRNRSIY